MKPFPLTVTELMQALEERYPEPSPRPGDGPDDIYYKAGQRSVVTQLRAWRDGAGANPIRTKRGAGRVSHQDTQDR